MAYRSNNIYRKIACLLSKSRPKNSKSEIEGEVGSARENSPLEGK